MLAVSVDLGTIKVAGKAPNLTLALSSSLTIALPPLWADAPTANELCHASSTGRIWISKAGSCQVDISSLVNNEVPDPASFDPSIMAAIASFLSDCPVRKPLTWWHEVLLTFQVWQHTGLGLRTNHAFTPRPEHSHAQASYFLHHPDLSSQLIIPPDVPWAQLQGLRCKANYHFDSAKKLPQNKAQSLGRGATSPATSAHDTLVKTPSHSYSLRNNPKRSAKAVVAHEDISNDIYGSPANLMTNSGPRDINEEQEDLESLVSNAIAEMASLLDFAFGKLVGVRGASPGKRTIKRMETPSLIDIAPAVWDLQYLQVSSLHLASTESCLPIYRQCLHTPKSSHPLLPGLLVSRTRSLRVFGRSSTPLAAGKP